MKTTIRKLIILFVILVISFGSGYTQTKEELQKRKQKTEEELKLTNQLLQETEKSKSIGLNRLLIIKKRISLR